MGTGATGKDCPNNENKKCVACNGGHFLKDGVCKPVASCSEDQFVSVAATKTSNLQCQDITVCNKDSQYEKGAVKKGSSSQAGQDRVCAEKKCTCPNGTGATGKDCPNNENKKCVACNGGHFLKDGVCKPVASCSEDQFVSVAATKTSNLQCQDITVCNKDSQYEKGAV